MTTTEKIKTIILEKDYGINIYEITKIGEHYYKFIGTYFNEESTQSVIQKKLDINKGIRTIKKYNMFRN